MEFIKKNSPNVSTIVTNRQATNSKQKKARFVEESRQAKKLLKQFAEEVEIVTETYGEIYTIF